MCPFGQVDDEDKRRREAAHETVLVLARYKEAINWLNDQPFQYFLLWKGGDAPTAHSIPQNVGDEIILCVGGGGHACCWRWGWGGGGGRVGRCACADRFSWRV
jgi:hypothetical protein